MLARVDPHPRGAGIIRSIDTAAHFAVLICVTDKYFVRVSGIDQDAGEVSKRKIASAPEPMLATVVRHVERLFGSDIDERRALRILRDHVNRGGSGNTADLLPALSGVA